MERVRCRSARCGTIEVKSSAYVQSWEQQDYSTLSFDIAKKKSAWNPKTGKYRKLDPPERIADVYVFCLLKHKCQETIGPLDVEQWEFFVVPRLKLDHSDWGDSKSLGFDSLSRLTNPDPNALVPVTVENNLRDGRSDTERVDVMYGNPARPMTRVAQLEKFRCNCAAAARPITPEPAERLIAAAARLESLSDVTALVDDLVPAAAIHPSPA